MEKAARVQWVIALFIGVGLMMAGFVYTYYLATGKTAGMTLIAGNDSMTRASMILENFSRGDWFNDVRYRIASFDGFQSHWSRVIELPAYLYLSVATLFVSPHQAMEFYAILLPMTMWAATFGVFCWGVRPLKHPWLVPFIVIGMIFHFQFWSNYWVGRLDIPTFELFFTALMFMSLFRVYLEEQCTKKVAAFFSLGLVGSLWTTPESFILLLVALVGLGLPWLLGKAEFASYNRRAFRYMIPFLLIALFVERGLDFYAPHLVHARTPENTGITDQLVAVYEWDRFSIFHAIPFFLTFLFWEFVTFMEQKGWMRHWILKVLCLGVLFAGVLSALSHFIPGVFNWRLNNEVSRSSSVYYRVRTGRIAEGKSIFLTDTPNVLAALWAGMQYIATYIVGLIVLLCVAVKQSKYWPLVIAYVLGFIGIWGIFSGMRFGVHFPIKGTIFLQILSLMPFTIGMWSFFKVFEKFFLSNLRWLLSFMLSIVFFGATIYMFFFTPDFANAVKRSENQSVSAVDHKKPEKDRLIFSRTRITKFLSEKFDVPLTNEVTEDICSGFEFASDLDQYLDKKTPQLIFAYPDVGSKILYLTPHKVASIPSHRFQPYLDVGYSAMIAQDPSEAKRILQQAGFAGIQICLDSSAARISPVGRGQKGFSAQLMRGQIPPWMKMVKITPDYVFFVTDWAKIPPKEEEKE